MVSAFLFVVLQILLNDWLPRVADLIDAMRKFWTNLVPRNSRFGGRCVTLFQCVHALMSQQLRGLIRRSIDHLYNTIEVYRVRRLMGACKTG